MDASASASEFATALVPEATAECGTAFVTTLEEQIERSKSHWSVLAEPRDCLSVEEAAAIKLENEGVFKAWQSHPEWGFFFQALDDFKEWKVGEKFATLLEDGRLAFVMEKEDEDLRSLIDRRMMESGHVGGGPFSRVVAEEFMCEVALGVDQLHRYNIVHRDLKASNVLVYTKFGDTSCVVADYECSIGVVGTRYWRAPEILRACTERNVKERLELFSKAADIYSLGMTFYEILIGKYPFQDEDVTVDLVMEGQQPHVPQFVDEWAQQLLHWCWQSDPDARPSIEDILGLLEANSSSKEIIFQLAQRLKLVEEEKPAASTEAGSASN